MGTHDCVVSISWQFCVEYIAKVCLSGLIWYAGVSVLYHSISPGIQRLLY